MKYSCHLSFGLYACQVASVILMWTRLQPDYASNMWNEALNKRLGTEVLSIPIRVLLIVYQDQMPLSYWIRSGAFIGVTLLFLITIAVNLIFWICSFGFNMICVLHDLENLKCWKSSWAALDCRMDLVHVLFCWFGSSFSLCSGQEILCLGVSWESNIFNAFLAVCPKSLSDLLSVHFCDSLPLAETYRLCLVAF